MTLGNLLSPWAPEASSITSGGQTPRSLRGNTALCLRVCVRVCVKVTCAPQLFYHCWMLEMGPGPAHLIFLELMAGGGDTGQVPAAGWVSQHSNRGLSGMGQAHLTSAWGGGGGMGDGWVPMGGIME